MCFRHGDRGFPDLRSLDMNRRSLMRRGAEGALVVGLGGGLLGAVGNALADTGIKATHGTGFCNLALFLAHARQIAAEDGVALEFVNAPTFADHVTFLATGAVDVSVLPYTSFVALHGAGAPVKIVAGGGIEGCVIVAQPGLDSAEKLKGKTLGTFQLDTLEVLPYDYLKANGVGFDEVVVRYMGSTPEAVEAFKAGALDWICTIEPYGTALLETMPGTHKLSDGTLAALNYWEEKGVNVAMGMDEAGINDDRDMLQEMRMVLNAHRTPGIGDAERINSDVPTKAQVLRMATSSGAATTPFGASIDTLEVGKGADLVLIDLDRVAYPYLDRDTPVLDAVLHRAKTGHVDMTMCAGEVVYEQGSFTKVDSVAALEALKADMDKAPSDEEVGRRELAAALYPHAHRFYADYFDAGALRPFYKQSSRV